MTGLILNGKAVCCMHMGNFDEAETLLLEALNKASLNSGNFCFLKIKLMIWQFFWCLFIAPEED